jgi:hypothetical protein
VSTPRPPDAPVPGTPGTAAPAAPRPATAADLPAIREIIFAAYGRYLGRIDRPPAPLLRDYAAAVEAGTLWVAGDPVTGLMGRRAEDGCRRVYMQKIL